MATKFRDDRNTNSNLCFLSVWNTVWNTVCKTVWNTVLEKLFRKTLPQTRGHLFGACIITSKQKKLVLKSPSILFVPRQANLSPNCSKAHLYVILYFNWHPTNFYTAGSLKKVVGSWIQTHDLLIMSRPFKTYDNHHGPSRTQWMYDFLHAGTWWLSK